MKNSSGIGSTRREFIEKSGTAASITLALAAGRQVHSATEPQKLKLGLVGCGGRGAGAANQALNADDHVELFSMCDLHTPKTSRISITFS